MTQLWTTTEHPPCSQDSNHNQIYSNSNQVGLPHYHNDHTVGYLHDDGQPSYSTMTQPYPSYSTTYMPTPNPHPTLMYMSSPAAMSMSYQVHPPPSATVPSQHRTLSHNPYYQANTQSQRLANQNTRMTTSPETLLAETEDQDSPNNETMRSEPMEPPLEGYPLVHDFDDLMKGYVENLSVKKQDKALIHAKRAANIKAVLIDKKTTNVESAQFRFWVKKMFTLEPKDLSIPARKKKICHEGKPVAIREKLFKILTRAHKQCQHGGRDKTSAQVRRVYSWVPKELISRFVKLCPTCQVRRGPGRNSPTSGLENGMGTFADPQSPELPSSNRSRRDSLVTSGSSNVRSPVSMAKFSSTFQQQNRWMTPLQSVDKGLDQIATLENAASSLINMNMGSPMSLDAYDAVSSRCTNDLGIPYMTTDHMHQTDLNSQYHHNGSSMQRVHDAHRREHTYRVKRESAFKQETRY